MSLPDSLERAASALANDADDIRPANGDPNQLLSLLDATAQCRVLNWLLTNEHVARPVGATGESSLRIRYMAKEVNLVLNPPLAGGEAMIELLQDGEPLAPEDAGADVRVEGGRAVLAAGRPGMWPLSVGLRRSMRSKTASVASTGLTSFAWIRAASSWSAR